MIRESLYTSSRWLTRVFVVRGAVVIICLAAVATLSGWAFGIPALRSLIPGAVQMKVNTALALLLAGIALHLLVGRRTPLTERVAALLGCVVAAVGAASLS